MTAETTPTPSQEQSTGTGQAPTTPAAATDAESTSQPSMSLDDALAALKKARSEAATYRTRLAEREKVQREAEEAALVEQGNFKQLAETAQRERDAYKAQIEQRAFLDLQREVAEAHKLPAAMADRLHGTTRGELEKDAKALAALVTPAEPAAPAPAPRTPAGNRPAPRPQDGPDASKRTEADMRASGKYAAL